VLAQTFEGWEMLIVEDGSDGAAGSVVAGFNDPRLRYIYQAHAGRSAARNRGLAAATGEFIAFLDDDDLYHPNKLAKEVAFLREHPEVDIVGSGFRLLERDGSVRTNWEPWLLKPDLNKTNCLYGCPICNLFCYDSPVCIRSYGSLV
jgi:glycosyltransferase involved in cell wall biosynthesis